MLKLPALMDGEEVSYPFLGTLQPIEGEPSRPVALRKKIVVYNLGSYRKTLTTPLYKKQAMSNLSVSSSDYSFDPASCLGVLCGSFSCPPDGHVTRRCGGHCFALPVYDSQRVSANFYRVAGYMITDKGYLAVIKRRWLIWLTLSLLCGIIFVLSYLLLQYGPEGTWNELVRIFSACTQPLAAFMVPR